MASGGERVTNDLFEEALSDSLKNFSHISQLKEEPKTLLAISGGKKGCFWNSSHWIWEDFDFPIAPTCNQSDVEIGTNDRPGCYTTSFDYERPSRRNDTSWTESICHRTRRQRNGKRVACQCV